MLSRIYEYDSFTNENNEACISTVVVERYIDLYQEEYGQLFMVIGKLMEALSFEGLPDCEPTCMPKSFFGTLLDLCEQLMLDDPELKKQTQMHILNTILQALRDNLE